MFALFSAVTRILVPNPNAFAECIIYDTPPSTISRKKIAHTFYEETSWNWIEKYLQMGQGLLIIVGAFTLLVL